PRRSHTPPAADRTCAGRARKRGLAGICTRRSARPDKASSGIRGVSVRGPADVMTETISPTRRAARTRDRAQPEAAAPPTPLELSARAYAIGIAVCSAAAAAFILVQ